MRREGRLSPVQLPNCIIHLRLQKRQAMGQGLGKLVNTFVSPPGVNSAYVGTW